MKMTNKIIPALVVFLISVPAFAQSNVSPWQAPYQSPQTMGPGSMSPEQMQEIYRQRHEAMMKRRSMMGQGMDCQHDGMGKKGHHGEKKHGKKHGNKHHQHRQQMEQRLQRIESMLQQLLDQQASPATTQE